MNGESTDGVPLGLQGPYVTPYVTQLGRYNGHDFQLIEAQCPLDFPDIGRHSQALSAGYSTWMHTGQNVTIIPCAYGGTGFFTAMNWMPVDMSAGPPANYSLYYDCTNRTNYVLSLPGYVLGGILWDQGEQEAEEFVSGDVWLALVGNLVNSWRRDLIGGANVPFVAVELLPVYVAITVPSEGTWLEVQAAIDNVPFNISYSATVYGLNYTGESFPHGDGGGIHYSALSQYEVGFLEYYALLAATYNYPGATMPGSVLQVFAVVFAPTSVNVTWTPDPVARTYRIYLGLSLVAVASSSLTPGTILTSTVLSVCMSYAVNVVSVGPTALWAEPSTSTVFSTSCG